HLASTHQPPESRIRVLVEAEGMMVGLDQIVPCGLIIHEAVANSFRHAFPGRDGEIRITAHSLEDGRIELIVADDGVGLSGGLEQSDRGKLGFRLITGLVEHQLRGTLQVETEGGTRLIITFTPREQAGPDLRDAGTTADFSGP
ncbi:MAG: sensor histidine kinase, partial [Proteobacteria bacterium]|nr:sensor histidine kinase [Pseudomonadota bacterium]